MKRVVRYFLPAAVIASALLLAHYERASHVDFAEHARYDRLLDELHQHDAALSQNVLKVRFRLLSDYDSLSAESAALHQVARNLAELPRFVPTAQRTSLEHKLAEFGALLARKDEAVEQFKSENAILNNSLRYLPTANTELLARLGDDDAGRALKKTAAQLLERVFVHCLQFSENGEAAIGEDMAEVDRWRAEHPQHPQSAAVGRMLAHVRSIVSRKPRVEMITEQIVAVPTERCSAELLEIYERQLAAALARSDALRTTLVIFCALLMGAIAYTIYALAAAKRGLARRVAERTAELSVTNERYRDLIRSLPAALYTCDAEGRVTLFNEAAATLWGREPELGRDLWCGSWKIFDAEGRPIALEDCPMAVTMREGRIVRGREITIERPDGGRAYVLPYPNLIRDAAGKIVGAVNMLVDLTERRKAEQELEKLHRQLLETSRQAGMAEVATGVLHNVGNVLNSVNVSATLVTERVRKSKASSLARVVALLDSHVSDLAAFLSGDPQGQKLPNFLRELNSRLAQEQTDILTETESLRQNIEHIKDIVSMQQSYAKVSGVTEVLCVTDLVEDSLRLNSAALLRHEVTVERDYAEVPPIVIEKHKALQVLVNLIRNAKHACDESGRPGKRVIVRVANHDGHVRISVADNGVGIASENLTRIFNHGFTTRKDGHGFGLHSGALAARDLGGSLFVQSEGVGCGATFTLELPVGGAAA